jgi:hypothetical protein
VGCRLALVLAIALRVAQASSAKQVDIEGAIEKGVRFLKSTQKADGTWPGTYGNRLGGIALAGLALCESGVPADDTAVRSVADFVRQRSATEYQTYDLSLSIMFLDKLTRAGEGRELRAATAATLAKRKKLKSGRVLVADQVDDSQRIVELGRRLIRGQGPGGSWTYSCQTSHDGDHSNTQFAVIGVWIAGQHGLNVTESLQRCSRHFRSCQSPEGGWGYGTSGSTPSMTCAGLMALATGLGLETELAASRGLPGKTRKQQPGRDRNVEAGLKRLERYLLDDQQTPIPGMATIVGPAPEFDFLAWVKCDFYLLWSLERVGVLYGTDKIGQVAWYPWGAERIVPLQRGDGSWAGKYGELICTSFALLFLTRANISPELSKALGGKFGPEAGLKAYRPGTDARKALDDLARRTTPQADPGEGSRPDAKRPATPPAPKRLERASVAQLIELLEAAPDRSRRIAAAAELEKRWPTYADVQDHLAVLVRLAAGDDPIVAPAARTQLANAFQRAQISHCLHWLGQADEKLQGLIWEQIDGRIARADAARIDEYRKVAAAVLREKAFSLASRQAAIELLGRLKGKAAAGELIDQLLDLPRELWPPAGEALRRLTDQDFGPHPGDGIAQVVEAEKRWRAWQKRPGGR